MKTVRRRRLEKKTDYKARFSLLKSEKPRLVVRKTNRYIIVQLVETAIVQDKVIAGSSSKDLLSKGWPEGKAGSLKNLAAAYLTGYALANKIKGKVNEAILDTGMNRNIKKSRVYAALKGAIDAGLNIPHDEEVLPSVEEIKEKGDIDKIKQKL